MKNEKLDEIEIENQLPKLALKSYKQFWYSIFIYMGIFISFLIVVKNEINSLSVEVFSMIGLFFGLIGFVFNLLGMRNSVKSKRNKEPFTNEIILGRFGNIGFVFVWIFFIFLYGYFLIFGFI